MDKWNEPQNYNRKRSQFWKVVTEVAHLVNPGKNLSEIITYTNLYKLAPDGKNPSQRLMYATDKKCIEIFRLEVEYYKPRQILFLTGWDWAEPFLRDAEVTLTVSLRYVQTKGVFNNTPFVVAVHPQGKRLDEVVSEIRKSLTLPIPTK